MIEKANWKLMKKFLDYRLKVDQISQGSLKREQTYMRYILEWADNKSFRHVIGIRPTLPEYLLLGRLDGEKGQLSAVYIKKVLATARLFFTWLSDNENGYKHIKQAWVKTLKAKRLTNTPRNREIVTIEEILTIANTPVQLLWERRIRAALVFLYLSGMRIDAFVSLPIQAVDIPNRMVNQFPSLGVRTKNRKHGTTYLLDIPELLKVVQEWDEEIRKVLPLNGLWFAPLSPQTGKIDPKIIKAGINRGTLAARAFREWLDQENLPYHSPHKFRHGHIHYGLTRSNNIADFKAVSLNALHSNMEITDQFYSVLGDDEVKSRIKSLNKKSSPNNDEDELLEKFRLFLEWEKSTKK